MAAALVAWRFGLFEWRETASTPDPLASIDARAITATTLFDGGEPQSVSPERARAMATAIASLKAAPRLNGQGINWAGARMLRARMADGIALSLQVVRSDGGGYVRMTADSPSNAVPAVEAKARELRSLRTIAYRLDGKAIEVFSPY